MHSNIEESIFHPKLQAHGDKELVNIVLERIEEVGQLKMSLRQLAELTDVSDRFETKKRPRRSPLRQLQKQR